MADTLTIDVDGRDMPYGSMIPIIGQKNPCKGYVATAKEIKYLIQLPSYFITESSTGAPVNGKTYSKYFPDEGGGGGGSDAGTVGNATPTTYGFVEGTAENASTV